MTAVLLTGASGVVGQALLDELTDLPVTCLTHRTPVDRPGVTTVTGDLTRPRLGLEDGAYRELVASTTAVVHCAAATSFGVEPDVTRTTNVRGTESVLQFAADAGAVVYHVSTAFVGRAETSAKALVHESTRRGETASPSAYIESKAEAERLVRDSGLQATILRPSVVMGRSDDGRIAAFQGLHSIAGAVLRGRLPIVPVDPGTRVDCLPQDLVARAIGTLVRRGTTGGEYWLTAGESAMTMLRMVEVAQSVSRDLGNDGPPPRIMSPDVVGRLVLPLFLDQLPDQLRLRFTELLATMTVFQTDEAFPCSLGDIDPSLVVSAEDLEEAFRRSLLYWAARKGLVREAVAS